MRLELEQLIVPHDFPPHAPPAAPEAAAYAQKATAATREEAEKGLRPERVPYGPDPAQRIDIYAPETAEAKRPVLLFFHGGAWSAGYLWWTGFMARAARESGALFIAGTYRFGPTHRYPAQLDDMNLALEWVRRNVGKQIVTGGHSSGGHLAALVTLIGNAEGVIACFPVSAPLDIRYPDAPPGSPEERVYKNLLQKREDDEGASPIMYAAKARVPFHLLYGERDFPRIVDSNQRFIEALKKAGKTVSAEKMAGASHFDTHLALREPGAPWYAALRKALRS